MITSRTRSRFLPPFDAPVIVLTSLAYFGYCFNPVSFYFVYGDKGEGGKRKIACVVAEVGNTPWGEEECYVLTPYSRDVTNWDVNNGEDSLRFIFDKRFHVSPFIGTEGVVYDWVFRFNYLDDGEGSLNGIKVNFKTLDKIALERFIAEEGGQKEPQPILTTTMSLKSERLTPYVASERSGEL